MIKETDINTQCMICGRHTLDIACKECMTHPEHLIHTSFINRLIYNDKKTNNEICLAVQ